ncbi:MAG: tautomerase family protein [Proteobacteria bacterium]|nr:tautomerase family protein [Pseudomonadota bacterium]MBU4277092.1 tautomerase family protein [Pseudomonadota bacterium]MBU4383525.1 tautomerase family protein [Pseudomonadota bacterium]MBU4604307.1 tautomerase family protein [Pseudomonadota bacterium]MCG2764450.1 tautomerase family protein [Desulfarculaceae bacterium]
MPVVILHLSDDLEPTACEALADEARHALVESLGLPPEFGKVILYTTPIAHRSVHSNRDPRFALAEVRLLSGRDAATKARLISALDAAIRRHTGLSPDNVFVQLVESPKSDWGLRGGHPADQVDLP